jgi:hypothetical protein
LLGEQKSADHSGALLRFVRCERLVEASAECRIPWRRSGLGGSCAQTEGCAQTQLSGGDCSISIIRTAQPDRSARSVVQRSSV